MAGGLTVSVRQIASYPVEPTLSGNELVLLQTGGGLGGPYATATTASLVATALSNGGALGINVVPPAGAEATLFTTFTTYPLGGGSSSGPWWNAYLNSADQLVYYHGTGPAPHLTADETGALSFQVAPVGQAGTAITGSLVQVLARLSSAGNLNLPLGTLTVARDPTSAMDVATMGWVGASTVASFNGRRGVVQLSANDVYAALCLDPCDPFITVSQTNAAICAAIQQLLASYPGVSSFNGRLGNVWLNVCDMNIATFSAVPGMPAFMVPTPAALDATPPPDPLSVVNIQWVEQYITQTADFATEEWVNQQIATALQGTVSSFNTRQGAITLNLNDITGAGGAPNTSPNFGGIPTAPTAVNGTSTAQIATTAFVMNTLTALTPGVVSFNGRAGTVTLSATDINNAGGALIASPNFTGTPAAPTAPAGTATSQIATTAFVMAEIAATTAGVATWNGRAGNVTMNVTDITAAGGAPAASPALTGIPTAPTAANGTSTTQLATTAFVLNEINAINAGVLTFNGRSGTVTLTQNDVTAVGGLVNPSAALTGTPTAPTPAPTDSSTNIATTAFVHAAIANYAGATVSAVQPPSPSTGALWFNTGIAPPTLYVYNGSAWVVATNLTAYAPLASPGFTGTPTAPTPAAGNNSTSIATTAFVAAALAGYLPLTGGTLTGLLTTVALTATGVANLNAGANTTTLNVSGAGGALNLTNSTGRLVFPTGTTGGINGDTSGTGAAAGIVGEIGGIQFGPSTGAQGVVGSVGQVTIPAGDWDVWGQAIVGSSGGSVGLLYVAVAICLTANSFSSLVSQQTVRNFTMTGSGNTFEIVQSFLNQGVARPVFLNFNGYTADGATPVTAQGFIWWRRRR